MLFPVANSRTDIIAGRLPLTSSSGFGWIIQDFSNAVFELDTTHASCPPNWRDLIEPNENYIVRVPDGADDFTPMQGYMINSWSEAGNGMIRIQTSTWERIYELHPVTGRRIISKDPSSEVFPDIASTVETDGVGPNIAYECPPAGYQINKIISAGERLTAAEVMKEIAVDFEYTTDVYWGDEGRTTFKKITRTGVPHLSAPVDNPLITFTRDINGRGNIVDYTYTDSRREDEFATFVIATGSGVDDDQIESAPIIDHEQEISGIRIPKVENFPGVTTVAEANICAQRMADNYFKRRNIVTLKVSTESIKPEQIEKGQFVRLNMYTRAGIHVDDIWRVIGMKESTDGLYFMPTLAKLGVKPKDFPRPKGADEIGREIRDIKRDVKRNLNRNPSYNGVRMRNGRIRDDGTIERRNPDGTYTPADAVAKGYIWRGTVGDPAGVGHSVTIVGHGVVTAANWWKDPVRKGDTVALSKDGDSGDWIIAWPIKQNSGEFQIGQFLIVDDTNASGFGTGSLIHMISSGAMYVHRTDGTVQFVNQAQGSGLFRHVSVYDGHVYATFTNDRNAGTNTMTVYRHDKGETTWTNVSEGLPATADAIYSYEVFGEVDARPMVAVIMKDSIVNNGNRLTFDVRVYQLHTTGIRWIAQTHSIQTPESAATVFSTPRFTYVYDARDMFINVETPGSGFTDRSVTHVYLESQISQIVASKGLPQYVGALSFSDNASADAWIENVRVSVDGEVSLPLVHDGALWLYSKGLIGSRTPVQVHVGANISNPHVQRDGGSNIFYVSATVDGKSMLWRVNMSNTAPSVEVKVAAITAGSLTSGQAAAVAAPAWPYQNKDGRISAVLADPETYKMKAIYFDKY
jgi:hypothetical protein